MVLVLSFIDVMNHIDCFVDIERALHHRYKSHLVVVNNFMTAFPVSQRFWVVVLSFSLASIYFLISSLTSQLAHSFFSKMFFSLQVFVNFPNFFLSLISRFIELWSENMHGMVSIFLYLLRADLFLVCGIFWRIFYVHWRRMYILLL